MLNSKIKLAILLFISPCISGAAAPLSSEKCSAIKNEKKRLACYDSLEKQPTNKPNSVTAVQEKPPALAQPKIEAVEQANKVIFVEAGLVYKSGDIKPVARSEFYLLDDSLVEIFKNANIKYPMDADETVPNFHELIYPKLIVEAFGLIHASIGKFTSDSAQVRKFRDFHANALAAIEPHIIQQATTGFSGKAKFESIKTGTYYLMGVYKTPRGVAVWNSRIDAKNAETTVVLDQDNAASVN